MSTSRIEVRVTRLSVPGQDAQAKLIRQFRKLLDEKDGLGKIMTALAHTDPEAITMARMWLDEASSPNGEAWDSRDIVTATGNTGSSDHLD